ncbi:MAG: DUF4278 domain-containing protein [Prochlorococcus sp. SP3034]|nr:DUF4278 domain-containing protein [Prochlorococcus sp. SP3034]
MTKLTYRGKIYSQIKKAAEKQLVELTYRKNVYQNRQLETANSKQKNNLTYRGVDYIL